jgi:hypothetical protein
MDILTAFQISIFDFLVVFSALMLIAISIKIFSFVVAYFEKSKKKQNVEIAEGDTTTEVIAAESNNAVGYGELKLFGVDEKTAAMIMAIVSDESNIPLAELQFKSIKLLEN